MKPGLSVVIVSYRSRAPLERCLASLRACREWLPFEVIVTDNASSDGTVEWIRECHPEVVLIANARNRGFTRATNQGLELARGDALLMLNPDCEVTPDALAWLPATLECDTRLGAVAPALVDDRGRVARSCGRFPDLWALFCDHMGLAGAFPDSPLFGRYKYGGQGAGSLRRVDWASGAALMISRRAYQTVGGLDENIFMYMEEVDWCLRASRAGFEVGLAPEARIVHLGQQSARQAPRASYLHNLRSRVYYFRKHHGAWAALAAKAILEASLALKWLRSAPWPARAEYARIYAAGAGAVWGAAWR